MCVPRRLLLAEFCSPAPLSCGRTSRGPRSRRSRRRRPTFSPSGSIASSAFSLFLQTVAPAPALSCPVLAWTDQLTHTQMTRLHAQGLVDGEGEAADVREAERAGQLQVRRALLARTP